MSINSMNSPVEKKLVDLYLSGRDILEEGLPNCINRRRSAAIEQFNLQGIPKKGSSNGDRYHYTDLTKVFDAEYERYFIPSYTDANIDYSDLTEGYSIDLLNGFCRKQGITHLDNGIVFGSLAAAANEYEDVASRYYDTIVDNEKDAISALNTAFVQDGVFVYIPKGVSADKPFIINLGHYSKGESLADFGRILLLFEERADAKVVINSETLSGDMFLSCITTEIYAGKGANVEVVEVDRTNSVSTLISSCFARQESDSNLKTLSLALSGKLFRGNRTVKLLGHGAENHTYGLYVSGSDEHLDFMTDIEHITSDCTSNEHFKGIAADGGTGAFAGRIYVAPDAQRTVAFQQNNNLLLGEDAHIYTKPQLEIYADNVKCSHGATVGQLDENALYYMRQRGISEENARKLQMFGFVNDIITKTSVEGLSEKLSALAVNKIENI